MPSDLRKSAAQADFPPIHSALILTVCSSVKSRHHYCLEDDHKSLRQPTSRLRVSELTGLTLDSLSGPRL